MQTEDEQVEKLKTWLKENGMSIVFGVIIGVGGIGGYNYWNHYQQTRAAAASAQYAVVMEALTAGVHQQVADAVAAVQLQLGDSDAALITLAEDFPEAFAARVDELRGDALAMQGKTEEAAEAYRKARSAELQPANVEFLQQKLDELGVSS